MTQTDDVHGRIKRVIVDRLQLEGLDPAEITDDENLFAGPLGLDSVDALELVVGIEQEFGFKVKRGDMQDTDFHTVNSLSSYVQSRLGD